MKERRLWSERHPWLAGLYFAATVTPLSVVIARLGSGRSWTELALMSAWLFPLAWVYFSLAVLAVRSARRFVATLRRRREDRDRRTD